MKTAAACAALLAITAASGRAEDDRPLERGTVLFTPTAAESRIAERFRLLERPFAWEARRKQTTPSTVNTIARFAPGRGRA